MPGVLARGLGGVGRLGRVGGRHGGLEGSPGVRDAPTTRLTGGAIEAPGRRDLEEGELTCHAPDSTQGV